MLSIKSVATQLTRTSFKILHTGQVSKQVSDDSNKPTRDELLQELESIRETLLPAGLQAESTQASASSETDKNSQFPGDVTRPRDAVSDTTNAPTSETLDNAISEVEALTDQIIPSNNNKDHPMNVLPGQQSLFDEEKKAAAAANASAEDAPSAEPASSEEAHPAAASAPKENPFLPRHIKQKLEKEKSLYQQQVEEGVTLSKATKSQPATNASSSITEDEALIDELVAEYLPKIEETLKQRLREKLQQTDESKSA